MPKAGGEVPFASPRATEEEEEPRVRILYPNQPYLPTR
jgi:hypothetical protein